MADLDGRGVADSAGWSTFETRMRRRRFERCLTTAREALASGELDRSRSALDEARALFPDAPEIPALQARLSAPHPPVVVEATPVPQTVVEAAPVPQTPLAATPIVERRAIETPVVEPPDEPELPLHPQPAATLFSTASSQALPDDRRRIVPMVIAVAAVLLFAVGGFMATQFYLERPERQPQLAEAEPLPRRDTTPALSKPREESSRPEPARAEPPRTEPQPEEPPAAEPPRAEPPRAEPQRAEPVVEPAPRASSRAANDRDIDAPPTRVPAPRNDALAPTPKPAPPTPVTADRTESLRPIDPLPAVVDRTATSPTTGSSTTPAAVASAPPPAATPALETPTETARPPARPASQTEEPLIRAVLTRYETAYNRLDATAASAVYPGVNREALGRAFGGLISQKVSLGLCDITVVGDIGGASCVGKARWEPRVGGGTRTADRRWTFSLRRGADGWRIEQVVVR